MSLKAHIESLLFVAGKPMTAKKIAEIAEVKDAEIENALKELQREYADRESGLQIFFTGRSWQMGTAGVSAALVEKFVKEEFAGELTRPQLETLTVIAYRGPISKTELEVIRGVQCGLILRNLAIRGLIDDEYDLKRKETKYRISMEFLRHLGVRAPKELPEYAQLHGHEVINTLLEQSANS